MTLRTDIIEKLVTPKPHKKGATEEHIFADNQRAKTTARLVAELAPSLRPSIIQGEGE